MSTKRHYYLYFVRSGNMRPERGTLRNPGIGGYNWSRTNGAWVSATAAKVYELNFHGVGVTPANGPYERWRGFPVRYSVY